LIQWAGICSGKVGAHVFRLVHTGDDRAYIGVVQDETQRHLGHGLVSRDERPQRLGVRDAILQVVGDKIGIAPVALGPFTLES
jgi:hypothetical protein